MIITYETTARSFEYWGAAVETIELAREVGKEDELYDLLDELFEENEVDETEFNDYVAFYVEDEFPHLFQDLEDDPGYDDEE